MNKKRSVEKYFKFTIYIIITIMINIAGISFFTRIDLTHNKLYSLSDISQKVVSSLSEPLTINVFFTKNLPAPHNNTERYLNDLLEEYAINGNKYFNYRFFDMDQKRSDSNENLNNSQELANSYGVQPVQIQVVENDEVKFIKAYMGLVIINGDMIEKIPTITTTDGLEYKLTTSIQKLNNKISALINLKNSIDIKFFMSSTINEIAPYIGIKQIADYPDKIKSIVDSLNNKNYKKLKYSYINPSLNSSEKNVLQKYKLTTLKWPDIGNGQILAGNGIVGIVMEYNNKIIQSTILDVIQIPIIGTQYNLLKTEDIKALIDQNIESLIDVNQNIGYLSSHGTLNIPGPYSMNQSGSEISVFSSLVSENYSIKQIDLKKEAIPDGLKSLIIAQPAKKFTDYELFCIDQALMKGTNLALFLDSFVQKEPEVQPQQYRQQPGFVPIDTGLEKLLANYGITIDKSIILDKNCFKQRGSQQYGQKEQNIYFAPIIKSKNINSTPDIMKNIKGLIAFKVSPIQIDNEILAKNNISELKLFSSSDESWEMKNSINYNPMYMRPPPLDNYTGKFDLAYLFSAKFNSFFTGKNIPEKESDIPDEKPVDEKTDKKPVDEKTDKKPIDKKDADFSKIKGESVVLYKGKPAKIFVMGSSEMIKNNILDPQGKSPNAMFVLNILDFLNDKENLAVMRSKQQVFNPLNELSADAKFMIKSFCIAGLPVLTILFGFLIWGLRHLRKKRIQIMFQE